jgi:uncharacterized protein (TIGR02271 family)
MTSKNPDVHGEERVVPLAEEELRVEKREVTTGKVRVQTFVDSFEEVARANLQEEHVEVTRVPIGKEVKVAPVQRTEGDVLIIPVVEEVLVVEKRLVLKEELRISRRTTREDIEVPVTIRKQRAVVERTKTETRNDQEAKR